MSSRNKLELTWVGKDATPRLEPRLLIENKDLSFIHEAEIANGPSSNILIQGDNLLALKALEADPSIRGTVQCACIDPPYNTGSAFEHYDDGLEHSLWLGMMRDRLLIIWELLSNEGSIWITIDDNEAHYLKVLCDELFGRKNFIADIAWQKRYSPDSRVAISDAHEHLLCYAKNPKAFAQARNLLQLNDAQTRQFKNPDNDPKGPWKANDFTAAGYRPNQMYEIQLPSGRAVLPPEGRCWRVTKEKFEKFQHDGMMYYGSDGNSVPSLKRYLSDMAGMVPWTWWPHTEVGHSQEAKKESQRLFGRENAFSTPKPERLIERIIHISTKEGGLVLDSFAGSGTTGAVAHKMKRRWIMIELGEHAKTHIAPRLKKVINGDDPGGVTMSTNWKGGGGFRFFNLSPSLVEKDPWGRGVISKQYNPETLAEIICKHFNYIYAPDHSHYWMHGLSSETSFIYVTSNSLTFEQLRSISEEVGENRSLLICCSAYDAAGEELPNLTLRKIPAAILDCCEWGRDDYSLRVPVPPNDTKDGASELHADAANDLFDVGE